MGETPTARTLRAAALLAAIAIGALAGAPPASADTTGPAVPFDEVIARARLVVVGITQLEPDGGVTVVIERVLAGTGPSSGALHFSGVGHPPQLLDGGRAVIAFTDPTTIDVRAPTTAWMVSEDGYVEPDGLARVREVPPTLAAMYTWFGQPMASPRAAAGAGGSLRDALVPILLVLVALAAAEGGIARRERGRRVPG